MLTLHTSAQRPPQTWIQIHESATAASMAAGAFSYALTKYAGETTTAAASQGISILGLVLAFGAEQMGDAQMSKQVVRSSAAAATVVEHWGKRATAVGSAMMCATTAAVVGSSCMIGKMAYELWKQYSDRGDEHVQNTVMEYKDPKGYDGTDFVIYEIKKGVASEVATKTAMNQVSALEYPISESDMVDCQGESSNVPQSAEDPARAPSNAGDMIRRSPDQVPIST